MTEDTEAKPKAPSIWNKCSIYFLCDVYDMINCIHYFPDENDVDYKCKHLKGVTCHSKRAREGAIKRLGKVINKKIERRRGVFS